MSGPDTIVAPATPPGASALAVIRLSGPSAFSILLQLCPSIGAVAESRKAILTMARDPETGQPLDQVVVTAFSAPGSYTGEDMVEISAMSSPV